MSASGIHIDDESRNSHGSHGNSVGMTIILQFFGNGKNMGMAWWRYEGMKALHFQFASATV